MNALGPTREPNLNACTIISSSWTSGVRDAVSNLKNDGEGRYRYTSRDRDFATEIPNRSLTTLRGLTAAGVPFCRLYRGGAKQKLDLFEFTSTSVAEARSSLRQEQDFSSKDHCVDLLTFSASTHSFDAISAKGE